MVGFTLGYLTRPLKTKTMGFPASAAGNGANCAYFLPRRSAGPTIRLQLILISVRASILVLNPPSSRMLSSPISGLSDDGLEQWRWQAAQRLPQGDEEQPKA